jgi:hypothetical protein
VESLLPFIIVAVVLVVAVIVFSRRQRDTSELSGPVRLGPSWSPPEDQLVDDPSAAALRERDLAAAKGAADLDERSIATTLEAWWEYLSVLRVRPLSRGHRYRFYDPYDPPVTELGPDGPVPDPVRVARDVAQRTSIAEIDAVAVLDAVLRGRGPVASERSRDEFADGHATAAEPPERDATTGYEVAGDEPRSGRDAAPAGQDGSYDDVLEDGSYDDVLEDPDDVLEDPDEDRRS